MLETEKDRGQNPVYDWSARSFLKGWHVCGTLKPEKIQPHKEKGDAPSRWGWSLEGPEVGKELNMAQVAEQLVTGRPIL